MGAEGPRSFSAIIAAKRAEFISYREVMTKLAEYTGEPLADIAAALKQDGMQIVNGAFLEGPERAIVKAQGWSALDGLLDETIRTGALPDSVSIWNEPDATSDGDGWIRNRFIELLRGANLPCPDTLETPGLTSESVNSSAESTATRWSVALRGMASFKLWEAACVLAGVDPYEPDWGHGNHPAPDEESEVRRYKRLLTSAIDAGDLPNNTWGSNRDEQEIPHGSIRAWCREYGYDWPIPEVRLSPATDAELIERSRADDAMRDRLRVAEAQCDALGQEIVKLTTSLIRANEKYQSERLLREATEHSNVADNSGKLQEQVSALMLNVSDLSRLLDAANARVRELSGNEAQGKSKTAMLQVIAGLWRANYLPTGKVPNPNRLEGLGTALENLQSVGVSIGEDALRGYIRNGLESIG